MDETALRLAWMRATLRLHCRTDVATFTDDEVLETFACLRERPAPFEIWRARIGLNVQPVEDTSAEQLIAMAQATAPNLKVTHG
jgi:hypothetical protein